VVAAASALVALALASCAGGLGHVSPTPGATPAAAPHSAPAAAPHVSTPAAATPGAAAAAGGVTTPVAARVDSTPSPEALAVLKTIPEPLGDSTQTAAPPSDSTAAAPDTSSGLGVPVPAPTTPLGQGAGAATQTLPDNAANPSAAAATAAGVAAAAAAGAGPDTCWRLQVGAPTDRAKAEALVQLASSQLITPFVIEREGQRFKVRARDCMSRAAADALKTRAAQSGLKGAFLVTTRPPGAVTAKP
jgi:hypothetical protein